MDSEWKQTFLLITSKFWYTAIFPDLGIFYFHSVNLFSAFFIKVSVHAPLK